MKQTFSKSLIVNNYRKNTLIYWLTIFIFIFGCQTDDMSVNSDPAAREYDIGKNRYTLTIAGDVREYYVHVPSIYDANQPTPVVFMLHGTSGNGEKFYNISGWKEVGEVENILTVYPSSWRHCIIDDGQVKNTTKWNVYPGSFEYCPGEIPRDDIHFLKQIIIELAQRFAVDSKRMYLAGFSNGGAMAGRSAVEMSDLFAAIVEASGTLPRDTTFTSVRNLPVIYQLGNSDNGWLEALGINSNIPMSSFEILLNNFPPFRGIVNTHTSTLGLASTYTLSGDTSSLLTATFEAVPPSQTQEFKFVLIKDLEHNYPNGTNHPLHGAEIHWSWMKLFTLP